MEGEPLNFGLRYRRVGGGRWCRGYDHQSVRDEAFVELAPVASQSYHSLNIPEASGSVGAAWISETPNAAAGRLGAGAPNLPTGIGGIEVKV